MANPRRLHVKALLACVLMMTTLSACGLGIDNMYKTSNANWDCWDGSYQNGLFCQTDNGSLTYGLTSGTSTQHAYLRSMLEAQFEPTDLGVSEQDPVVYSGSSETDIVYQIGATLPPGAGGITWCDDAVSDTKCDQHYVRLASDRVHGNASTPCHETAHAVGLTHGGVAEPAVSDSDAGLACLRTPGTTDSTLGTHNQGQINGTY